MDTISRENNSILPIVGIGLGVVALALAGYTAANISKLKTTVAAHEAKLSQIPDDIASQVSAVSSKADQLKTNVDTSMAKINQAFTDVGNAFGEVKAEIAKIQESQKRPAAGKAGKGGGGPVVAGPGEYVVKSGDTLSKIARANGCTVSELQSVNPGVDSKHLHLGQKLKLPEKASAPAAAPAPAPAAQ